MKTRIVIVDDSPLIRQVLADIVRAEPDMEVVGTGRNGEEAIALARDLKPDAMTLDVEMPRMSGLEALGRIMEANPTPVVMVSTLTSSGAAATIAALEKGAVDCVCKPANGSFPALRQVRDELLSKLRAAAQAKVGKVVRRIAPAAAPHVKHTDRIVLIASSTGGPKALCHLWESLPKGFNAPILIVQHMPAGFTEGLAKRLDAIGTVACKEAKEGDRLVPGLALMAPGGRHMTVDARGEVRLNDDAPLHGVRPAADFLFQSAAKHFNSRCVASVLTGMGKDGAEGALAIRNAGGTVFGESEETCTVYGMPRAAMAIGAVHAEVPLGEMAHVLTAALSGRLAHAS